METCEYCKYQYHPMLRMTNSKTGRLITVCEYHWNEKTGQLDEITDCVTKAIEDGFVYRRDLTPKR